MRTSMQLGLTASIVVLLAACEQQRPTEVAPSTAAAPGSSAKSAGGVVMRLGTKRVIATGLLFPRGLTFASDGSVIVAEAGTGGTTSTVGTCAQVPPPVGPFKSGNTGRISRIDRSGSRTTVIDHLPSSISALGDVLGTADVSFIGGQLYALLDAGCGHGVPNVPASVARVQNQSFSVVANLTLFHHQHPVKHPEEDDFEPDGDWYSMIAKGGTLFAMDANGGQLVSVDPASGSVTRVADISATQGHIVPTVFVAAGQSFIAGNLGVFPQVPGESKLLDIARNGVVTTRLTGFNAILGLARAAEPREGPSALYVLESFKCPEAPLPCVPAPFTANTGRVTRILPNGTRELVATGLNFPTSMRFGPDGALYISNNGYGVPPGTGEIVRLTVP